MKLTGMGNLDTLVRQGERIGVSRMDSGVELERRARSTDIENADPRRSDACRSGDDYPSEPVCRVCQSNQARSKQGAQSHS